MTDGEEQATSARLAASRRAMEVGVLLVIVLRGVGVEEKRLKSVLGLSSSHPLGTLTGRTMGVHEVVRCVDQPDMRKRLREVADQAMPHQVVLFGEKAKVVAQRQ